MGASSFELAGTFIVSLIILMFYARKCTSARATQWITTQRLTHIIKSIFRGSSFHFVPCVEGPFFLRRYDYERYCNIESHGVYFKEEPIRELHRALERLNFQIVYPNDRDDLLKLIENNARLCGVILTGINIISSCAKKLAK